MEKFLKGEFGKNFMKLHLLGQYFLIKMKWCTLIKLANAPKNFL
jgi:hypothetical protein